MEAIIKLLGNLVEITSTKIRQYTGDISGHSIIANFKGKSRVVYYNYPEDKVKEFIKRLKEEIRWRIKAMARGEYTPQQTLRNLRESIKNLKGDLE